MRHRAAVTDAAVCDFPTALHWQRFALPCEYPIAFTRDLFHPGNPLFAGLLALREDDRHRCLVFLDEGLARAAPTLRPDIAGYARAWAGTLELAAPPVAVPGGAAAGRDPARQAAIRDAILASHLGPCGFVVAVGGGAVLDAVSVAAATTGRGLRCLRVPSSVFAQCETALGLRPCVGPVADLGTLGTVAAPWGVVCDLALLDALPARQRRAGLAAAVRLALTRDAGFFRWIEARADALAAFDPETEAEAIRRASALARDRVVEQADPFAHAAARALNLGRWSAGPLMALAGHDLVEGEALAIGIALDTRLSVLTGRLAPGEDARVTALLARLGLPRCHRALDTRGPDGRRVLAAALDDRAPVTQLDAIGAATDAPPPDPSLAEQAIDWLAAGHGC